MVLLVVKVTLSNHLECIVFTWLYTCARLKIPHASPNFGSLQDYTCPSKARLLGSRILNKLAQAAINLEESADANLTAESYSKIPQAFKQSLAEILRKTNSLKIDPLPQNYFNNLSATDDSIAELKRTSAACMAEGTSVYSKYNQKLTEINREEHRQNEKERATQEQQLLNEEKKEDEDSVSVPPFGDDDDDSLSQKSQHDEKAEGGEIQKNEKGPASQSQSNSSSEFFPNEESDEGSNNELEELDGEVNKNAPNNDQTAQSAINLQNPNFERFNPSAEEPQSDIILEPGETIQQDPINEKVISYQPEENMNPKINDTRSQNIHQATKDDEDQSVSIPSFSEDEESSEKCNNSGDIKESNLQKSNQLKEETQVSALQDVTKVNLSVSSKSLASSSLNKSQPLEKELQLDALEKPGNAHLQADKTYSSNPFLEVSELGGKHENSKSLLQEDHDRNTVSRMRESKKESKVAEMQDDSASHPMQGEKAVISLSNSKLKSSQKQRVDTSDTKDKLNESCYSKKTEYLSEKSDQKTPNKYNIQQSSEFFSVKSHHENYSFVKVEEEARSKYASAYGFGLESPFSQRDKQGSASKQHSADLNANDLNNSRTELEESIITDSK